MADKLYDRATKGFEEASMKLSDISERGVKNKELRNKILRTEVPKAKTTVIYNAPELSVPGGGSALFHRDSFKGDKIEEILGNPDVSKGSKKLIKKVLKKPGRTSGIAIDKKTGDEFLAHELGHAQGKIAKGRRGRISRKDPRRKGIGSVSVYAKEEVPSVTRGVGFKESVRDFIRNSKNARAVVAEENAATKAGLDIMKRAGATKEELKRASKNLRDGGDSYRALGKFTRNSSLGRIVDIPSRRGQGIPVI